MGKKSNEDRSLAFVNGAETQKLDFLEQEPYASWTKILQEDLSSKRFKHVLGVVRTALYLADTYRLSGEKAAKAALLHDCAKKNEDFYFRRLHTDGWVKEEEYRPSPTFHAWLGARVSKYYYGVDDPEILEAIEAHTTGKAGMGPLAEVIFLADMLEPHRSFPGLEKLRTLALEDLDQAVLAALDHTMIYLMDQGVPIDEHSLQTRNDMIERIRKKEMEKG